MKIAICFAGFLRSFKFTVANWNLRLKNTDVDFYINAPNTYYTPIAELTYDAKKEEKVELDFLKHCFGDRLKNANIFEYNPEIFKAVVSGNKIPEINKVGQQAYRIISLLYNIQEAIRMVENSNTKYDLVMLTRADVNLYSTFNFHNINHSMINYPQFCDINCHGDPIFGVAPVFGTNKCFNDQIFIAPPHLMFIYRNVYDMVAEYFNRDIIINSETLLGIHAMNNNVNFGYSDFARYNLLRFAE